VLKVIERRANRYLERVVDTVTGDIIRDVDEPLKITKSEAQLSAKAEPIARVLGGWLVAEGSEGEMKRNHAEEWQLPDQRVSLEALRRIEAESH
jgi:hypothetical protein